MPSGFTNFVKTILAPLTIATLLYLLLFHALLPLYRRHHARYSNYEPLLPSSVTSRISQYTPGFVTALYSRITNSLLFQLFSPSTWVARSSATSGSAFNWRYNPEAARHGVNPFIPRSTDSDDLFDEEEGEGMVGFNVNGQQGGDADRERYNHVSGSQDSGRRLSRELEEGFRDDSEDEEDSVERGRRTSVSAG